MKHKDPTTPAEWQEAVNAAEFALLADSAKQYGLIEGGQDFNIERCEEILKAGRKLGYRPDPPDALCRRFIG